MSAGVTLTGSGSSERMRWPASSRSRNHRVVIADQSDRFLGETAGQLEMIAEPTVFRLQVVGSGIESRNRSTRAMAVFNTVIGISPRE